MQKRIAPKGATRKAKQKEEEYPEDTVKISCPRGHTFVTVVSTSRKKYACPFCRLKF